MKLTNVPLIIFGTIFSILAAVLLIGISPILFAVTVCCIAIPKILISVLKLGGCIAAGTAICCKTAFKLAGAVLKAFGFLILLPLIIIGLVALALLIIL